MKTLLLAEPDVQTATTLRTAFQEKLWHVLIATTASELMTGIEQSSTLDLILTELDLPDTDGLLLLDGIRKLTDCPLIILTGRCRVTDIVFALKLGADDFVCKPVVMDILEARVNAVVRRFEAMPIYDPDRKTFIEPDIEWGPLKISRFQVLVNSREVHFTPIEHQLLRTLAEQSDGVVTDQELIERGWGVNDTTAYEHLIEVHIGRMRAKLWPELTIVRKRNVGYKLDVLYSVG